jgi:hypothetical protein
MSGAQFFARGDFAGRAAHLARAGNFAQHKPGANN